MTEYYEMDCGCKFPILDGNKKSLGDNIPPIEIDFDNINERCPKTYELLASGRTVGVFQLEKSLGQGWSRRLQPIDVEEISHLISIIRPGTLKSKMENAKGKLVSMTEHFVDRKHFREEFEPIDESISEITDATYSIIVYQEQAMNIAKLVAKFTLEQADQLRRAMGKKDAALMAKTRIEFISGCKTAGIITDEKANEIFDIIEKSNRYSFNKSHGVSYGKVTYWSAYAKAHFPHLFFTSYLANAENKADSKDEVNTLVNDGRSFGMEFRTPTVLEPYGNFTVFDKTITCGLGNIAKIGDKKVTEIQETIKILEETLEKKFENFSWFEVMIYFTIEINSEAIKNLISVGAFGHLGIYRRYMLFEFSKLEVLTDREITFIRNSNCNSLIEGFEMLLSSSMKIVPKRIVKLKETLESLRNPPNELKDNEDWISNVEKQLIGTELTCSKLDGCNTSGGNCICSQFNDSSLREYRIAAVLAKISEYRPKQGKLQGQVMAYVTLKDSSGSCDAVAFPAKFKELDFLLFEGNTVCVIGKKTDSGSLQINDVIQL
jgi:DNA polymerase-3 subunit alpha